MKKILVLGAGRSSPVLINYFLDHANEWDAAITVGDHSLEHAKSRLNGHERGSAIYFDAKDEALGQDVISNHDIVISLLPPDLHFLVATECLRSRKHLVTASYVSPQLQKMNEDVKQAGLLFMCEMGLDPGIDHMSAMSMIHKIQDEGGVIVSFKSGTGGLVAEESDDNPWHYKVTWNPRNVVLAGQGTAQYLDNGIRKFIPYHRLFTHTEKFKISGHGKFESYPNRDSLSYISKYNLNGVQSILRSTLRKEGYCEAWNALVQMGLTDDSYLLHDLKNVSYADWISGYIPEKEKWKGKELKSRVAKFLDAKNKSDLMERLEWLGLFSTEKIPLTDATPAQILQDLIERKWMMGKEDNDMIVMRHEIKYAAHEKKYKEVHTLIMKGEDATKTAMAKTVGLPMGIMVRLLLKQDLFLTGVHIPVMQQVYEPVLNELESFGVKFSKEVKEESME